MFPTPFAYHRASSVADAISVLASDPEAKLLAGGHSLIPAMKLRLAQPSLLVDIGGLDELRGVELTDDELRFGAMATYDDVRDTQGVSEAFPTIPESIAVIGDQQVRAHGTIGGALAHNDPAADFTAVFLALGGSVAVTGPNGSRSIDAEALFVDLWTTSIEPEEIVTSVTIPVPASGTITAYVKHPHPASGYAVVGVAVSIAVADGVVSDARIVTSGATSKPEHAAAAEQALTGRALDADTIAAAAAVASEGLDLNGDHYASAVYRGHLIGVLTKRAIERGLSRT